jgi:CRISPR system Cascade subunit CasA
VNLLKDIWLPVIRRDGAREKIAIHQLLENYDGNPVVDIEAPRPDLRNALYQLLIGIVQVAAMPKKERDWKQLFMKPYRSKEFTLRVLNYVECFEIDSEGPAFMQDLDLQHGETKPVAALLIETPGGKAIKENRDHFIKRNFVKKMDSYWAAIALFTIQTFAPSGGVGHRVGLRGGGPLTTILLPKGNTTLWKQIWCNIVSAEYVSTLLGDSSLNDVSDIFPWMKPSKLSHSKGSELYSGEVHPFHHFFGMPRRMRLNFSCDRGKCDLTGDASKCLVTSYITKNYGNNYDGAWKHPLNAYGHDPKKTDVIPISIKAQPGGVGYRHWLGLAVESERIIPATVVKLSRISPYRRDIVKNQGVIIWVAGFDMDNMKARCWYESRMPLFSLSTEESKAISHVIGGFIKQANELSASLRSAVKAAWFSSPKNAKGDMSSLDAAFWQNTESDFYKLLKRLIGHTNDIQLKNSLLDEWFIILKREAESLFDANALAQQEDGLNMKRVIKARLGLGKGIGKMFNNLKKLKGVVA